MEAISEASFDGTWPFTVASGTLRCVPGNARPPLGDVVFNAAGTNYGINGAALHDGFPDPHPIRKPASRPGRQRFVPVGDLISEGATLCPKLGP